MHYYPKINVAAIKLVSDLKVGDEIVVIGKTTGVLNTQIKSMEIKKQKVSRAKKGDEIGIIVKEKVRKGYKVFKK